MSKPHAVVSASLSARGRAECWANEAESAVLSGMSADVFSAKLPSLEMAGFPKKSPWNSKRFVPAILEFWSREHENAPVGLANPEDDERAKERFGHERKQHVG